ncbi:GatB/YqeY domain-containing protein [Arcobacter sp. 15-2]|uniref:GatB/YqeY domain-containing protein n=1 Tax=Arcobacter sp. 15-2 TaxID=3374109 RepID=UPI00399CA029
MSLKEQLKSDLKEAMKAKDIKKRDSIRSINTMIKQIEVDERIELDDAKIIQLIQKGVKQREEAIIQFKEAKRDDLVANEQEQIDIFSLYLPKQLTDDELEILIQTIIDEVSASSMKDMGKIMNPAKEKVAGRADGKRINQVVKKLLS